MVFHLIPVLVTVAGFAPNVYYGLTKGDWLLGWDYALTGRDYVGEAIDKILTDDPVYGEGEWDSGLTDGDYNYLDSLFGGIQELIILAIVVILGAFLITALFKR